MQMNLKIAPFNAIKNGTKTVEMRLFDDKRQKLSVGETVTFVCDNGETLCRKVKALKVFADFAELYHSYDKVSLGYDKDEVALPSDMLCYYDESDVKRYGVVAIELE